MNIQNPPLPGGLLSFVVPICSPGHEQSGLLGSRRPQEHTLLIVRQNPIFQQCKMQLLRIKRNRLIIVV